ncbi:VOC family protein [Nocardioides sp. R-C-SC26]|uniref:VOC family protein n=1 Tax=Nocardioides sp. R-C-SC26 TaxID=2870414 RepID=UPI001E4450CD|nr:VOC family protein [Nocardioides sp. R-C-SC26]
MSQPVINPYLQFRGQAEEAMTFYQSIFGGELSVMRYADMGGMGVPEAEQQQLMHADLVAHDGLRLMGADVPSTHPEFDQYNVHVSISGDDDALLGDWYTRLGADGGSYDVPYEKAPWGDYFGQVKDRFGINWLVNSGSGEE